jgi:apolipoprotein N-acyltransferase
MQSASAEAAAQPVSVRPGSWRWWAPALVSAGLLELPFPLAGPMPPWRAVFAWFGLAPLLWALVSPTDRGTAHPRRRGFLLGYLCGIAWYAGNCYWIYDTMLIHGGLPPAVSVLILLLFSLVLGLYFGLFGLGVLWVRQATGSVRLALLFAPFLWTALELAAARITSVPWDQLGYSQVDNRILTWLAPWTGVYGISFVLVALNAWIAGSWLRDRQHRRWLGLPVWGWVGLLVMVLLWSGVFVNPPKPAPSATAVLIQPNLDVENTGYWLSPEEWERYIAEFIRLGGENCKSYIAGLPETGAPTGRILCPPRPTHPDLVVWPESPAPFFEQQPRFPKSMAEVARAVQAPVIVNGVGSNFSVEENAWQDHVSAMVYNREGDEVGRYDKIHLVPWGEYVPFPKIFFFARKLTGRVAHFTPGTVRHVFHLQTADGQVHRYGVFICYESVFADEIRQFVRQGAEVLVNLSDDGWYGDTSAPWQHLNMVRMRAIENRRWILRDTNNGVTAAIDPYGQVRQSLPRHQVDALPAQFGFRDDVTFYSAHGDLFGWVCVILSLGVVGLSRGRSAPETSNPSQVPREQRAVGE